MYWLPMLVFVPHMLEEFPRFPAWATRHFGVTTRAWYVYSHSVLVILGVSVCAMAQAGEPGSWSVVLGLGLMSTMAFNGLFHVATTILFREYSPGLVTALLLFFPATAYMLQRILAQATLTLAQIVTALALGALVQVGVVASLYLRMDIDWALRRGAPTP